MKRRIKSIKQHTLLLLVSLTVGLAILFSLLALVTAFVVEDMLLDKMLEQQAIRIEQSYAQHGNLSAPIPEFFSLFPDVESLPGWAQSVILLDKYSGEIFTPDTTHYHYRQLQLGDQQGYLLAEVSKLLVVSQQPGIFIVFLLLFLVAIVFAVWLAFGFSRRIVNPVLLLTDAVIKGASDKKVRLPKLPYELGYLSDTLQTSFDRLNQLLENEKAFSTNVSHELRTPLTVIKNAIQLIEKRGLKADDVVCIKNASEQMEQTVNVLLALARTESRVLQSCDLKMVLEQAILRCSGFLENFDLQVHLSENILVKSNPVLLELLFINLLRNATEHASDTYLIINEKNGDLVFENKTNQYMDSDFTSSGIKSDSSKGVGQGLYLVARIVEYFGWQLAIQVSNSTFRVLIKF